MELEKLVERLESLRLPLALSHFIGDPPKLPYVIYDTPRVIPFYADGEVYFSKTSVSVLVCAERKRLPLELAIRSALRGFTYAWSEGWNERENRYEYTISLEVY